MGASAVRRAESSRIAYSRTLANCRRVEMRRRLTQSGSGTDAGS